MAMKSFFVIALFALIRLHLLQACSPKSVRLERCLILFLERDFTLIEDFFDFENPLIAERRVHLEAPDVWRFCL